MTDFLKTWLNAAAAAINASTGIPYAPVPADMRDDLFSRAEAVRAAKLAETSVGAEKNFGTLTEHAHAA